MRPTVWLALLSAGSAACGRLGFEEVAVDAALAADAPAAGPWGSPVALDSLNTPSYDGDPSLTGDGLEIFFISDRSGGADNTLWHAVRPDLDSPFAPPEELTELIGTASPEISRDGLTLHFAETAVTQQVYRATRPTRTAAFEPATAIGALSPAFLVNVAVSGDERVAAVDVEPTPGDRAMQVYERDEPDQPWGAPVQATALDTPGIDGMPALDDDGLVLYFASDRGGNREDIYVASRASRGAAFGAPAVALATASAEIDPFVLEDLGRMVLAISTTGLPDLYETTR